MLSFYMLGKPFNFVIFSILVSKNFGLFVNWREKRPNLPFRTESNIR